jgi:hypothetical protein
MSNRAKSTKLLFSGEFDQGVGSTLNLGVKRAFDIDKYTKNVHFTSKEKGTF